MSGILKGNRNSRTILRGQWEYKLVNWRTSITIDRPLPFFI